jgi:hypothetical protein
MAIAPIPLHTVLAEIDSAPSFKIRYVECDVNRKRGGRVVERLAVKLKNSAPRTSAPTSGRWGKATESKDKDANDPYAFHIKDFHSEEIKGVHARLIVGFDDQPVRY